MDKRIAPTDWRTVLKDQGRTYRWLALKTGWNPRTVYSYSGGVHPPTDAFLAAASRVLGVEVTA